MKTETAIKKILASDAPTSLKILKLKNLALRTYPSSPNQKAVVVAYTNLMDADTGKLWLAAYERSGN